MRCIADPNGYAVSSLVCRRPCDCRIGSFGCCAEARSACSGRTRNRGRTGTCWCLTDLNPDDAQHVIEFYQCATAIVSTSDCNSPTSFQNLTTSIMSECASGTGAAQGACEDYIGTVKDCISLAFPDPDIAARTRGGHPRTILTTTSSWHKGRTATASSGGKV